MVDFAKELAKQRAQQMAAPQRQQSVPPVQSAQSQRAQTMPIEQSVQTEQSPTETELYPMPEEFNEDDVAVHGNGNTPVAQTEYTVSTAELQDIGFNDERDEQNYQKLNPPVGDWIKDDRWQLVKQIKNGDCATGDIDSNGRIVYLINGQPQSRTANNIEYKPMLFFRLSPDIRYKQDKPAEVDLAHKLFLRAKELYTSINGRKVRTERELAHMLTEESYVVRTMAGDNGPVIVDIKAKRQQR